MVKRQYSNMTSLVLRDFCARQPQQTLRQHQDANNNDSNHELLIHPNMNLSKSKKGDKYSLRPRGSEQVNSITSCLTNKSNRGGSGKSKQKAAPLSKYRRKTANARERTRMREINLAFEALRSCVPLTAAARRAQNSSNANEKLTKITTLRLAMQYIAALSGALQQNQIQEEEQAMSSASSAQSPGSSCNTDALRDFDLSDASSQDALFLAWLCKILMI
ncbi:helix-loop-helix protein delilah-like [Ctenocephalides felis]|uniref:helix-loop-helix protein delilah-like n=1 Tax=Ctenocephalides felis TaxID=7515 RepID=UPI000E6E4AA8|nr:helix-loop-helix protein delilah-like [Ctenocephalides felis]